MFGEASLTVDHSDVRPAPHSHLHENTKARHFDAVPMVGLTGCRAVLKTVFPHFCCNQGT